MKTIATQSGVAFELRTGQRLRVVDPEGKQVSDFFCFNARDFDESLSSGRSIDYADTILLTAGHSLYSNRSTVMLDMIEDSCGRHDFLLTPCSLAMFHLVSKSEQWHPSCHENLAKNFAPFGIGPDRISTTFNIFMNVAVSETGAIKILPPRSVAGSFVVFEAKIDLIVGLTACSHEETNAGVCKPILYEVF